MAFLFARAYVPIAVATDKITLANKTYGLAFAAVFIASCEAVADLFAAESALIAPATPVIIVPIDIDVLNVP